MPVSFRGPLPPDHPIFHGGVSFVFRHDLPEADDEQDVSAVIIVGEPISTLEYAEQLRREQEAQEDES